MQNLNASDPKVAKLISLEARRQNEEIDLIASENYASAAVMEVQGSILTNKYAEGYPHKRYYGGCRYHDELEELAISRAKKLFGAEHANVQPHSGSSANIAAYFALLDHGDTILAMSLDHGGHLTHGAKVNFSGKFFDVVPYGVKEDTGLIDYDAVEALAKKHRPKLIVVGASAYSRQIDFKKFQEIKDSVGAYLLVDMAHIAGLVAAGVHPSPVPYADVVTTTTHKTLRGPRGGMILCKESLKKKIDSRVFPGFQGGPLMHVVAAKAVCFKEAMSSDFRDYQVQVISNAKTFEESFKSRGVQMVSHGTDNHLLLLDLGKQGISGMQAEDTLSKANIVVNKNKIPFDQKTARVTSGIRIGTPAITTRGMKTPEVELIATMIADLLQDIDNETKIKEVRERVQELCHQFPM